MNCTVLTLSNVFENPAMGCGLQLQSCVNRSDSSRQQEAKYVKAFVILWSCCQTEPYNYILLKGRIRPFPSHRIRPFKYNRQMEARKKQPRVVKAAEKLIDARREPDLKDKSKKGLEGAVLDAQAHDELERSFEKVS